MRVILSLVYLQSLNNNKTNNMKKSLQLIGLFIFGFYALFFAAFLVCAFANIPFGGAAQNTPQILIAVTLMTLCLIGLYATITIRD